MSEDNRKRFKYLSHLPLHSEFKVVELELIEPELSENTRALFAQEMDERRQMRQRKEQRDKRLSDRAAAASSLDQHSHYYCAVATPNVANEMQASDYSHHFPSTHSPPLSDQQQLQQNAANTSFAQMLKHPSSQDLGRKDNGSATGIDITFF